MAVTNTNHDNKIDDCVEIIANEGNNDNLVPEPCRLEICQKNYTTEDFRVKHLHRKRVIFDTC